MRIHPEWRFEPFGKFESCPSCLGTLQPTVVGDRVNFVCTSCGCCWHLFLGYVNLVDPRTCPGCALHPMCSVAAYLDCLDAEGSRTPESSVADDAELAVRRQ